MRGLPISLALWEARPVLTFCETCMGGRTYLRSGVRVLRGDVVLLYLLFVNKII